MTEQLTRRDEFVLRIIDSILKSPQLSHHMTPKDVCTSAMEIAEEIMDKLDKK